MQVSSEWNNDRIWFIDFSSELFEAVPGGTPIPVCRENTSLQENEARVSDRTTVECTE